MVHAVPSGVSSATHSVQPGGRERFAADELAIVLSHFDIGILREVREFPRGSRKAPKLYLESDTGTYLLKRRARGRDDAQKVAFSHRIQQRLSDQQFPLPHLIPTRRGGSSMLQHNGMIYEMFEYIPGQGYPGTLDATFEAGRVLALYHKLLEDFVVEYAPVLGSYHNAPAVENGLRQIGQKASLPAQRALCQGLIERYRDAAMAVESLGIATWPSQIVHADWHPGNMLFREGRIVAVIDYDSTRMLPRIIDTANGALQFSILGSDEPVEKWPDFPDESRFKRFVRGYDDVQILSHAELETIPHLMVEALIAESVFPIVATGQFSRYDGIAFLAMVKRKTDWLISHAQRLVELVAG